MSMDPDADSDELSGSPTEFGLLTNRQSDLGAEPEDGLVTCMALLEEDFDLAQRACEELYRRHAHFLVGWCVNNRAETYGRDALDLVNVTFERALRAAPRYRSRSDLDSDGRRRHVIAWLFKILENAYRDSRKAEQREPLLRDDSEGADGLLEESGELQERPDAGRVSFERRNLVRRFLDSLDAVTKAILIATAECWSPTVAQTVLPRDVRESLCEEFGLTDNSLRVRRSRALGKLRSFILEEESKNITTT
jgi:RNA polymerase sigma factor (sigma-70 family)